jgi:uncharacterized protein (TIGR01777 family)
MDVAISGASGLIGTAFAAALIEAGHRPLRLVRRRPDPGRDEIEWDPADGRIDAGSLEGVDAVVNLSGAGIGDRRWTASYKQELVTSRTGSTALLARTIADLDRPPSIFLSGSAIGYYGSRGDTVLTEGSPPADDFLARLCVDWEAATAPAEAAGVRTCHLRTGIVLSGEGGALSKLVPLFKLGLGGRFGRGDQYLSWITIDDQVRAMVHLLEGDLAGAVNLTAPNPVTNAEFTSTLARVLGRPSLLPIPAFGPRILMGTERADALLFDSIRVLPQVLTADGFAFASTDVEPALRSVIAN